MDNKTTKTKLLSMSSKRYSWGKRGRLKHVATMNIHEFDIKMFSLGKKNNDVFTDTNPLSKNCDYTCYTANPLPFSPLHPVSNHHHFKT